MPTKTSARTVPEYLRGLDPERRAILSAVRKVVNQHLPEGYAEGIAYGMIALARAARDLPRHLQWPAALLRGARGQQELQHPVFDGPVWRPEAAQIPRGGIQEARQEAGHGQVVHPFQDAGRPAARRHRHRDRVHAGVGDDGGPRGLARQETPARRAKARAPVEVGNDASRSRPVARRSSPRFSRGARRAPRRPGTARG